MSEIVAIVSPAVREAGVISFEEALELFDLAPEELHSFIDAGIVETTSLNGLDLVSRTDVRRAAQRLSRSKFAHLEGQSIRLSEAARKYDITEASLSTWAKAGKIGVLERGPKKLCLNEADVAYAKALATLQGGMRQGRAVFPIRTNSN